MKPNEGRLQTAEHILARTIEHNIPESKFTISTFKENSGKIEVYAVAPRIHKANPFPYEFSNTLCQTAFYQQKCECYEPENSLTPHAKLLSP
jgi:hypothetical protein